MSDKQNWSNTVAQQELALVIQLTTVAGGMPRVKAMGKAAMDMQLGKSLKVEEKENDVKDGTRKETVMTWTEINGAKKVHGSPV